MKKLIFSLVAIFAVTFGAQAQEGFSIGAHVGLPTGDYSDFYTVGLGADLNYMVETAPNLMLGGKVGYSHFIGDKNEVLGVDVEIDDLGMIPLALTGYYNVTPEFTIGTDLGAAFFTEKDSDTSFYYQPKLGYDFGVVRALLGYEGFTQDGDTLGSVNLGVQFGLGY